MSKITHQLSPALANAEHKGDDDDRDVTADELIPNALMRHFCDFAKTQSWQPYGSALMSCSIFLMGVEIQSLSNM